MRSRRAQSAALRLGAVQGRQAAWQAGWCPCGRRLPLLPPRATAPRAGPSRRASLHRQQCAAAASPHGAALTLVSTRSCWEGLGQTNTTWSPMQALMLASRLPCTHPTLMTACPGNASAGCKRPGGRRCRGQAAPACMQQPERRPLRRLQPRDGWRQAAWRQRWGDGKAGGHNAPSHSFQSSSGASQLRFSVAPLACEAAIKLHISSSARMGPAARRTLLPAIAG